MKRCGGNSNTYDQVKKKKTDLKRPHVVQFQQYDILEKEKSYFL